MPNTEEAPQFESESAGPVFDQLEGDQFGMEEAADDEGMEESLGKANGLEDDSPPSKFCIKCSTLFVLLNYV